MSCIKKPNLATAMVFHSFQIFGNKTSTLLNALKRLFHFFCGFFTCFRLHITEWSIADAAPFKVTDLCFKSGQKHSCWADDKSFEIHWILQWRQIVHNCKKHFYCCLNFEHFKVKWNRTSTQKYTLFQERTKQQRHFVIHCHSSMHFYLVLLQYFTLSRYICCDIFPSFQCPAFHYISYFCYLFIYFLVMKIQAKLPFNWMA